VTGPAVRLLTGFRLQLLKDKQLSVIPVQLPESCI